MIIGTIDGANKLDVELPRLVDTRLLIQANSGGGKSWLLLWSRFFTCPASFSHPALVILDEAHLYCPSRSAGEAESTDAVIALMSQGRKRGLCGIIATQRLSKLHKDAAAETNNVIIGRTWLDGDQQRAGDLLGMSKPERLKLHCWA